MTAAVYQPCRCGVVVLTGRTDGGDVLTVEPARPTWCVLWPEGTRLPRLVASRAYVQHVCATTYEEGV